MNIDLVSLKNEIENEIIGVSNLETLEAFRVKYLGRKSVLSLAMKELKNLPSSERGEIGNKLNSLKEFINDSIFALKSSFEDQRITESMSEKIDVTIPVEVKRTSHPLRIVQKEIEDIFVSMGFLIEDGPEIEYIKYNFDFLNAEKNHPSRDETDTFYMDDDHLLRTQTSPVQIRTMLNYKPPIRIISPGRVYRRDEVDATHSPVFHQIEGLIVDENITFASLKYTMEVFLKKLYGEDTKLKFRPHNFPFTEPSAEVDIQCFKCKGNGCGFCKNEGYVEILGCGMVHQNVLRNCGIDPTEHSGFAFGLGLERITMFRYDIDDIRLFYSNDTRFLKQFYS